MRLNRMGSKERSQGFGSVCMAGLRALVFGCFSSTHHEASNDSAIGFDALKRLSSAQHNNTLCLKIVEVADGAHGFDRWPEVMAGGQGMQMGRYMHYPRKTSFAG